MRRIVVGVDGSVESTRALEWAAAEARRSESELLVLYAWTMPVMAYSASFLPAPQAKEAFRKSAKATMDEILANADVDLDGVRFDVRVVEGHAGDWLVRASRDADMVVVGHRERRPIAEFVLGSTAQYVSRHAVIPVVVVPEVAAATVNAA